MLQASLGMYKRLGEGSGAAAATFTFPTAGSHASVLNDPGFAVMNCLYANGAVIAFDSTRFAKDVNEALLLWCKENNLNVAELRVEQFAGLT